MTQFRSKIYCGNLLARLSDHMPRLAIISNKFEDNDSTKFNEIKFKKEFSSIDTKHKSDLLFIVSIHSSIVYTTTVRKLILSC